MLNNRKLLVVVVTYNAMKWCKRCLDSILSSSVKSDVFIVDNGSTDNTRAFIKYNYPNFLLYESDINLGFGKANNLGLIYALNHEYDYVYLLNQDAWVSKDTFQNLINLSLNNVEYGIISPMQLTSNMNKIDRNFGTALERMYCLDGFLENFYFNNQKELLPIKQIQAAHWLISLPCIKKVGLFSPSFPHYGEDNNYCQRVWYHGLKVGVGTNTVAVHDREGRKDSEEKKHYLEYIKKVTYLSNPLITPRYVLMSFAIRSVQRAIKFKSRLPILYYIRFLKEYKLIKHNRTVSLYEAAFIKDQ